MAVRGMAPDLVDQHLQAEPMGPVQQYVEILERAEHRVHGDVVGYVVAKSFCGEVKNGQSQIASTPRLAT